VPWPLALGILRRAAVRRLQNDAGGALQSQEHNDAAFHFRPIRCPLVVSPSVTLEPGPSRVTRTGPGTSRNWSMLSSFLPPPASSSSLSPFDEAAFQQVDRQNPILLLRPVSRQDWLCVTTPIHSHPHPPTDSPTFV
jgi:hypothetical protein